MYELRDYQHEIKDKTRRSIARGNKHVMIASGTGTGKTIKRWFKHYRIKQAKKRRPIPTSCNRCGSTDLVRRSGTRVHARAIRCGSCNRHLKWLSKEQV